MPKQSNGNKQGLGAKLSHKHEAILNWLIAHPDRPLRECAAHFGVGAPWLSCIIHSDAFRARLAERQEQAFVATTMTIRKKLEAAAHMGVERLSDIIEDSADPKFLLDATDKVLHRLGFAPRGPGNPGSGAGAGTTNIQQNVYMTDPAQLAQARELMEKARALRQALPVAVSEAANGPQLPTAGDKGDSAAPPLGKISDFSVSSPQEVEEEKAD